MIPITAETKTKKSNYSPATAAGTMVSPVNNLEATAEQLLSTWLAKGYPYARHFINPKELIHKVRAYKPSISYQRFNYLYRTEVPEITDHRFRGKYISIAIPMDDYNALDIIVDYYTEESRIKCALKIKKSLHELITKHGLLEYTLRKLIAKLTIDPSHPAQITYENYRDEIYNYPDIYICSGESTLFYKGLMHVLFGSRIPNFNYSKLNIMDGAIGYGQRLMLAILLRCNYKGIDPNTETIAGCQQMIQDLGNPAKQFAYPEGLPGSPGIARVPNNSQDVIFFSPPSFDEEIYGEHEGQSILLFKTFYLWLEGFLYPSLRILVSKLKKGGYMVIQSRRIRYIYKFLASLPNIKFVGVIARRTYSNKFKPNHIYHLH